MLLSLCLLLKNQNFGRQQIILCIPATCPSMGSTEAKRKRIWPLTSPSYQDYIRDSITSVLTSQKPHGQMKGESRLIGVREQCAGEGEGYRRTCREFYVLMRSFHGLVTVVESESEEKDQCQKKVKKEMK